ncbi:hypothetical protein PGT21_022647 [Puccinia graminis f. sp. tritici]|uniref:Uncharacterized protein n=1 Tax=Puccinia graminis f. sp. tritici TaxID=56615 RepID=A0A5B0LL91_PUCGR|nr:hypothetical protein PGT21_022647 [Puccinia graminis f. sp. tritici]
MSQSPKSHRKYTAKELEIEEHYEWLHETHADMVKVVQMWEPLVYRDTDTLVCSIITPSSKYFRPMIDCTHWFAAKDIQLKADGEAADLGIPQCEVPNIMEIWAQRRAELARGKYIDPVAKPWNASPSPCATPVRATAETGDEATGTPQPDATGSQKAQINID